MRFWCLLLCLAVGPAWAQERSWNQVRSFGYQLQELDLEQAAASPFDLLVTDVSLHGDEESRLPADQVKKLQSKPDGSRRLVLAYLSIGEAEDYRGYWKSEWKPGDPAWLTPVNPEWAGNYPVRFWDPEWQTLIFTEVDRIVAAGFDGVYLDRVDAYELFPEQKDAMVDFVLAIAQRARAKAGADFGVFPQNAEELLGVPRYLDAITGIGKEDLFFGLDGDGKPSPPDFTGEAVRWLEKATQKRKLVLNIDYTSDPEQVRAARSQAESLGFLEFVADRELKTLALERNLPPAEPSKPWAPIVALLVLTTALGLFFLKRRGQNS